MATRKSVRLAEKGKDRDKDQARVQEADRDKGRRASVGDVLGLTPAKPKGNNLNEAKSTQEAEAAAARLDAFAAAYGGRRRKRMSKKRRKGKNKHGAVGDKQTDQKAQQDAVGEQEVNHTPGYYDKRGIPSYYKASRKSLNATDRLFTPDKKQPEDQDDDDHLRD